MDELRGLWRGKHDDVDSSEWVSGYLVKMWEKFCLQDPQCENRVTEVAPSTLGECTGLRDKNGTPIFEGDILHFANIAPPIKYFQCPGLIFYKMA